MLATRDSLRAAGFVLPEWLYCVGPEVRRNRNLIVRTALTMQGWDWLLWLDGDTSVTTDTVAQMVAAGKDVLCGAYKMRGRPDLFAAASDGRHVPSTWRGLTEVTWGGAGLMLNRRPVLEDLPPPWFRNRLTEETPWDQTPEDVGFCMHAREHGYEIWLLATEGIVHHSMDADVPVEVCTG
jgi:hypothetical protein